MPVRIHVLGAAHVVTGSSYLFEAAGRRFLVDCGMFQGTKTLKSLNYGEFPFAPDRLDAVLLTHAHIDHSGLIPKLTRAGYQGPIYATRPTVDLCSIMLPDSGHIQEMEVDQLNRRNIRSGAEPVSPIYTAEDAVAAMTQFRPLDYCRWLDLGGGIRARWWNAGHILGSASIEIEVAKEGDRPLRILMSGDLGPDAKLFHPDPDGPVNLDLVVCEATYGDRDRPATTAADRRAALAAEVRAAAARGGPLLIPCFAVERTQEILSDLLDLMQKDEIPTAPVFLDSPLAIRATDIFRAHAASLRAGEALAHIETAPQLRFTESVDESKALARFRGFHIVIAASGMAEAGRIRHHLRNHLWRAPTTVLFVGYQAEGTLGRILLDGAPSVTIQGDAVKVKAAVRIIDSYSGHADRGELMDWLRERAPVRGAVALVHAEERALQAFAPLVGGEIVPADKVLSPRLDDILEVSHSGVRLVLPARPRRLAPERVSAPDWHNASSAFLLDLKDALDKAADDRARGVILRRLRKALEEVA